MATKVYRLKVRKIPLAEPVPIKAARFPPFNELHLDLLENKIKLKKNPPKPMFVRDPEPEKRSERNTHDDLTLDELEKAYDKYDSDKESIFSDHHSTHSDSSDDRPRRYSKEEFQQQEENEEDQEEKERQDHADLLFKFMVLKRQYPNVEIPEFSEHSDINTMRRVYEQVIRRVNLDSSVESYKQYLLGGFMVLEWVATNWLNIDLSGFTQQQARASNRYDRLLIELGEKNYSSKGSRFPVEVRLIFLIIFNAGLFYVQKMIFGGGGGGTDMMSALFGGVTGNQASAAPAKKSRSRMRGPTITPQEVDNMTRHDSDSDST